MTSNNTAATISGGSYTATTGMPLTEIYFFINAGRVGRENMAFQ